MYTLIVWTVLITSSFHFEGTPQQKVLSINSSSVTVSTIDFATAQEFGVAGQAANSHSNMASLLEGTVRTVVSSACVETKKPMP